MFFLRKAEKRRELESTLRRKEEELCQEIEEKMRKKRRRRKMILSLPESMCSLHPPLRLGSKHFSLNLPKPEDEGFFPVDGRGSYSRLGSKKIDRTEKQLRRMKKRERRERRRREREEKIREGEEEFKSLRSRRDVSCPEVEQDSLPLQRPPTPKEKLKKGFGWVLEYVPFGENVDDIKGEKKKSTKVEQIEMINTASEGAEESMWPHKTSPSLTEQVANKVPIIDEIPTNLKSPQCNFRLDCEVCDIKMKTLSALYSHYASHFSMKLEKRCGNLRDNLRCLICGQSYKSRHILTHHIGVKHGKINDILAEEGFKVLPCPVYIGEGKKREEMQRTITSIKKEKEDQFEEGNQIDENKIRLTADHCGSELVVPDAGEIFDHEVAEQKVRILIQDQAPAIEEIHQSLPPNKPKGNSDKENNRTASTEVSQTKQARGPKIVLSKKNSDKYSKEKTEECRYRIETVREGNFKCENPRAGESSNRPSLPPLKIKAPVKSFCETLRQIEYCEREKGRKKKKRKREKAEEEEKVNIFSQASLSEGDGAEIVQDTSRQSKPGGEDLHYCYEVVAVLKNLFPTWDFTFLFQCKSIFISKEGLVNHKKAECE